LGWQRQRFSAGHFSREGTLQLSLFGARPPPPLAPRIAEQAMETHDQIGQRKAGKNTNQSQSIFERPHFLSVRNAMRGRAEQHRIFATPSDTIAYHSIRSEIGGEMPATFVSLIPNVEDLLSPEVEDLAGVVLEVIPDLLQNGLTYGPSIGESAFPQFGPSYPENYRHKVIFAIAEAVNWLLAQGLLMPAPDQSSPSFIRLTRRGEGLVGRAGVAAYRSGRALPVELLQEALLAKVRPQFLRGDYDVAVFQAFKIVEVQVRKAANEKGAGYPDNIVGVDLMRRAFHPDSGPLTDQSLVPAEKEAMAALFVGAIGHAKNPNGHRDVSLSPERAARLIVFSGHLLDLVFERAQETT
jgi:uncharacterized protein (TIGR02391 family)